MSKKLLVEYLSAMGRCGRHFSMHDQVSYHDFYCRKATKALELMEVARKSTNWAEHPEEIFTDTYLESGSAMYLDSEITELVECINGGIYYGPPGIWLEGPRIALILRDYEIPDQALLGSQAISMSPGIKLYQEMLGTCLNFVYNFSMDVDITLEALYAAGLEDDEPFDYDNM